MKVLRKLVSLRLSPELIKMGKIEAEEQGRSFSNYIEYILVQHFKNQKGISSSFEDCSASNCSLNTRA